MTVWLTVYRDDADRHQEIISAVRDSANAVFGKVEAVLATQPYIAGGEFSAADIMMGFTLGSAKWLQLLTDAHPKTRSEEHTSELQSLMRISYAVFCLKKKKTNTKKQKRTKP